jgi:hypothetical protein
MFTFKIFLLFCFIFSNEKKNIGGTFEVILSYLQEQKTQQ